ncbi:MAG: DinB family protein [Planctomycetota bacterium]
MNPLLAGWADDARQTAERIHDEFLPLSDAQASWKPRPESWSIGECFDHLRVTGEQYYPRIDGAIERAKTGDASRPYKPRFLGRLFVKFAGPDGSRGVKAPKAFAPTSSEGGAHAVQAFLEQQSTLLDLIERAGECDLNGGRFGSPVTRLLRFSLGEALELMVRHEQRHLNQALRVKGEPAFPRE